MRRRRFSGVLVSRRLRLASRVLACVLIGQLALPTRFARAADGATDVLPGFSEDASNLKQGHESSATTSPYEVSAVGSFDYQYPIRVPPGRNGHTPSLSLVYSSAESQQPSAFGAGWSLPISEIGRSFKHGTPRIVSVAAVKTYDDTPDTALFDRDGVDLVVDQNAPVDNGRTVYRDRTDRSFSKSFFHAGAPSYWLVIDKDGTRRYYGNVPDQSMPEAVTRNELGISAWQLVRTIDPFDNAIDHFYVQGPSRTLDQPQLAPLPFRIEYGRNDAVGRGHFARIEFVYRTTGAGGVPLGTLMLDMARGHRYLDRVLAQIDESFTVPSPSSIRSYVLDIQPSPATGRQLLMSMSEQVAGSSLPATRFEYTRNDGVAPTICASDICQAGTGNFVASAPLAGSMERDVFRHFWSLGTSVGTRGVPWLNIFLPPTDPDGHPKWSPQFLTSLSRREQFLSPPGIPNAFRFQDMDGDGDLDILYHPAFLGGFGLAQPWLTFIQGVTGFGGVPTFSPYLSTPGQDVAWQTGTDRLQMRQGASQYVDVDSDGYPDRVVLVPRQNAERAGASRPLITYSRPTFDFGNPDCVRWARIGPRIYPIPRTGLGPGFLGTDIGALLASAEEGGGTGAPLCTPIMPDSAAQELVEAQFAFARNDTLNFPTQPIPAGGLDSLPPSLDKGFDPLIVFEPRSRTVPPGTAGCPTGPIGPITTIPIDASALTVAHNGTLAVNLDKLLQNQIDPLFASLGINVPTDSTTGYRIVVAQPIPDHCPAPNPVPTGPIPGLPPSTGAPGLPDCIPLPGGGCIRIGPIGPAPFPPAGPPMGPPGIVPLPPKGGFDINTFDFGQCWGHEFSIHNSVQPVILTIGRNSTADGDGAVKSTFLGDFPFPDGPTYIEDDNPFIANPDLRIVKMTTDRYIEMPIADLDNDGYPELVVLKSNRADPSRQQADAVMRPGVWHIRNLKPIPEAGWLNVSATDFRKSLKDIMSIDRRTQQAGRSLSLYPDYACSAKTPLTTPGPNGPITWPMLSTPKLLSGSADWVSLLADVNADGLPDLVLSKGATCVTNATTDHQAGFDIYLNRGDRFDTSAAAGEAYAHGPFDMVKNWNAGFPSDPLRPIVDDTRFPFAALSFSDLDGDGTSDAVIYARAGWPRTLPPDLGSAQWPSNPLACVADMQTRNLDIASSLGGLQGSIIRCVWRGGAQGWRPALDLASKLPGNGSSTMNAYIHYAVGTLQGLPYPHFIDAATIPDISRFADLDTDGTADLIATRAVDAQTVPETDPTRVHRHDVRRPDLLQGVDNGVGDVLSVAYRPAGRSELERVPTVPWVVDRIADNPYAGIPEGGSREDKAYTYLGGAYDFKEREFLGFGTIRITSVERAPTGVSLGTRIEERAFYRTEQSTAAARNPLKGILKATTTRDAEGLVEVVRTEKTYEIVPPQIGNIHRVRATSVQSTTCPASGCVTGGPKMDYTTTFSQFDDYDNAQLETSVASRSGFGDGFDGAIAVTEARTFQNNIGEWILGQLQTYDRSDANGLLKSASFTYRHNKVARMIERRLGVLPTCNDTVTDFITERDYDNLGNLTEERSNNDQIAGGAQPRRRRTYDPALEVYPLTTTEFYTRNGVQATLVKSTYFDARFGTVTAETDPNGNTTTTLFDLFGRPQQTLSAEGTVVRDYLYDMNARPTRTIVTDHPSFGQPDIDRVSHYDGRSRVLQSETLTDEVTTVDSWVRYDTLGNVAEAAVPFEGSQFTYVPRSTLAHPLLTATADALGRPTTVRLADGRFVSRSYQIGTVTDTDARGTPRTTYVDGFGRGAAVDEYFRHAGATGQFDTYRTTFTRDGDGRIVNKRDAETQQRAFAYNQKGALVSATSATGTYQFCYDGAGALSKFVSPAGRVVRKQRDEMGRVIAQTHEPAAQFSGDDVTNRYDDTTTTNGRGRLTSVSGAKTSVSLGYDARGNVSSVALATQFGSEASPWQDGTYTSSATYDFLGRVVSHTLPYDPQQIVAPVAVTYTYDERGLPRSVRDAGIPAITIDFYNPSGKPRHALYRNGTTTTWNYDANERLTSSTTFAPGSEPPMLLDYAIPSYDENNNPTQIQRFYGDASPSIVKNYSYDSLDRLEGGSITGLPAPRPVAYSYSPSGNMLAADGRFTYRYEGPDPQAVSSRTDTTTAETDSFGYDNDGQMTTVARPSGNEIRVYDGDGRLTRVTTASSQIDLRYDVSGNRILKRVNGTPRQSLVGAPTTGYTDLAIGDLELRGATTADGQLHAFYNVTLGGLMVQTALRKNAQGLLERDSAADRTYHQDYLGSTALVTASNGQIQAPASSAGRIEYGPYGETLVADASADRIRARFNGKELDESGLTYYEARYADPSLARWTARDPLALTAPGKYGQSANLYAFADNNPAKNIDPFGRDTDDSKKEKQPPPPPPKEAVLTRGQTETTTHGETTVTMSCSSTCPNEKLDSTSTSKPAPPPAPAPAAPAAGEAASKSPGPTPSKGDEAPPPRTGWDLFNTPQAVKVDDYGQPKAAATLAPSVVKGLQPVFDDIAKKTGTTAVPLGKLEVFVGTKGDRGHFLSSRGFEVPTPGSTATSYNTSLKSVLHELGHQVQARLFGEAKFLQIWHEQNAQYGESAYDVPGTLEYEAQQFMQTLYDQRGKFGL